MPGVYKIPMVRMATMPDETPECKGLKVPHTEMYVWFMPRQCGLVGMVVTNVLLPAHGEAAARRLRARKLRRPVWSAW